MLFALDAKSKWLEIMKLMEQQGGIRVEISSKSGDLASVP